MALTLNRDSSLALTSKYSCFTCCKHLKHLKKLQNRCIIAIFVSEILNFSLNIEREVKETRKIKLTLRCFALRRTCGKQCMCSSLSVLQCCHDQNHQKFYHIKIKKKVSKFINYWFLHDSHSCWISGMELKCMFFLNKHSFFYIYYYNLSF